MTEEINRKTEAKSTKIPGTPQDEAEKRLSPAEIPSTQTIQPTESKPTEIAIKRKEISKAALAVLTLADVIYRNKGPLQFSVFEIKSFIERIHPDTDIDAVWSELRDLRYVPRERDFESFFLNYESQEEMRKHHDLLVIELQKISTHTQPILLQDESLKRLLLLGYLNEFKAREFLNGLVKKFDSDKRILSVFFLDKDFCQLVQVEKSARNLLREYPAKLAETAMSWCNDSSFLLGLASLRMDALKERLGLSTIATSYYSTFTNSLRLLLGDQQASDVVGKLLYLGLTDTENIFGLNVDSILLEDATLSKLRGLLAVDPQKIKKTISNSWRIFNSLRGITQGSNVYLAEPDLTELLRMNALIMSKDKLLATLTLGRTWQEVDSSIKKNIEGKLSGIDNAVFISVYDKSQLQRCSGCVVLTLEGDIFDDEILQKNVVIRLSPREIGFESDRIQNEEYNALGDLKNLSKVKSLYTSCNWVSPQNHYVERAKAIIDDMKIEKITLEEAIRRLAADGIRALDMISLVGDKATGMTAIGKGYFKEQGMWADVQRVMQSRHGISNEDFEEIRLKMTDLVEKRARINLLSFSDTESIAYKLFPEMFESEITKKLSSLDINQKRALYVFLKEPVQYGYEIKDEKWLTKFRVLHDLMFTQQCKTDLPSLLVSVGLANETTWVTSTGNYNGPELRIVRYFDGIKSVLLRSLEAELRPRKPNLEEFRKQFALSVPMLAGVEYILMMGGYVDRSKLRDYLWSISLQAWNEFQDYPGLVSSKEAGVIGINPLYSDGIQTFVREGKKNLLDANQQLIGLVKELKSIDSKLDFNSEISFFEGFLVTPDRDEFKIIISPWLFHSLAERLGTKSLLILTNQSSESAVQLLKASLKESIVVTKEGNKDIHVALTGSPASLEADLATVLKNKGLVVSIKEDRIRKPAEVGLVMTQPAVEKRRDVQEAEVEIATPTPMADSPSPSLDDMLFEPNEDEEYAFSSVVASISDRPVCVVAEKAPEDEYIHTLQLICRELYRIKSRGLPRSTVVMEDRRQIEEELDASKKIFVVDDSHKGFFEFFRVRTEDDLKEVVTPEKVEERLKELFSQGYGYLIFYVDPNRKTLLEQLLLKVKYAIPELKFLKLRKLSEDDKRKISSLTWGFVEPQVSG